MPNLLVACQINSFCVRGTCDGVIVIRQLTSSDAVTVPSSLASAVFRTSRTISSVIAEPGCACAFFIS